MTDQLPAPLVPAEVDLRDFAFMPLDVRRLRDSRLIATRKGDEVVAAVLLWSASWHQTPASSLPNDDVELSSLAGCGRAIREFKRVRDGAMHGLILCSDNRWYHPVVAEKAAEAWNGRLELEWRRAADRVRKENGRKDKTEKDQPLPPRPLLLSLHMHNGIPRWMPCDSGGIPTDTANDSSGIPASVRAGLRAGARPFDSGQGKGIADSGKGTVDSGQGSTTSKATSKTSAPDGVKILTDLGVDEQHAKDWLKVRKAKRAPLTDTALDDLKHEAGKAGITGAEAVAIRARRSWQSFNHAWDWQGKGNGGNGRETVAEQNKRSVAEYLATSEKTIEGERIEKN